MCDGFLTFDNSQFEHNYNIRINYVGENQSEEFVDSIDGSEYIYDKFIGNAMYSYCVILEEKDSGTSGGKGGKSQKDK